MKLIKNSITKNEDIYLIFIYQLVYVLSPLITLPYTSRILGAYWIGEYAYVNAIASYFMMFIRLGVMTHGSRSIAKYRDDTKMLSHTFCNIYIIQLSCGLILTSAYYVWTFFSRTPSISRGLLLMVLSSAIDITWFLYGVEDIALTTIRYIVIKTLTIFSIFSFVKTCTDINKYVVIIGLGNLLCQAIAWPRVFRYISYSKPSITAVKKHLRANIVLFIPTIAVSLYKIMDKIMLALMSTSVELGYYEISERIINVPTAFISAFGIIMLPKMSYLYTKEKNQRIIDDTIEHSLVFVLFLSSAMAFGIMSVANQFVPLFYGTGFEQCITIYKFLLPSCIFIAFANVLKTQYLLPQKKDREFIVSTICGALINLTLNYILIPQFASIGAAIATLLSEIVVCLVQVAYSWQSLSIKKTLVLSFPFILSGTLMFLLCQNLTFDSKNAVFSLIVKTVICMFIYFVFLFLFYFILPHRKEHFTKQRNDIHEKTS